MFLLLIACLVNQDLYDERLAELIDQDGDGFASADYPEHGGNDCDDNDPDVNPGQDEVPYDQLDNDCDDGTPDDDLDDDGYGLDDDCDDGSPDVNPAAQEVCDGVDNDCDGVDSCLPSGVVELEAAPLRLVLDDAADTATGATLSTLDFDGDGLTDLVVGSPLAEGQAGRVDIVSGLNNLGSGELDIDDVARLTVRGTDGPGLLGSLLLPGCDLDGDGFDDLVLGVSAGGEGRVHVFEGGPIGVSGRATLADAAWSLSPEEPGLDFGSGVACTPLDEDIAADLVVGEPLEAITGNGRGRAWVFTGRSDEAHRSTADAAVLIEMGTAEGGGLGGHVGDLGDLDGDGQADIGLSSSSCVDDAGCLWIAIDLGTHIEADETGTVTTDELQGRVIGDGSIIPGTTLPRAGDVDGDGRDDLLLAGRDDDLGVYGVWLFTDLPSTAGWALRTSDATASWSPTYAGEQLTSECAGGVDVDGDGHADVLIGEQGSSEGASGGGAALLFLGGSDLQGVIDGDKAWATLASTLSGGRAGAGVALGQDSSGDGLGDMFVGVPHLGSPGGYVGAWWGGARPQE